MKLVISAALLALFVAVPTYATQEPEKDKDKPRQEEPKKEPKKQEPDRQQPEKERQQVQQQQDKAKQPDRDAHKRDQEQADKTRQAEQHQQQQHQNEKQQQQVAKQQQQNEKDRAKQDHAAQEHAQQVQRDDHNHVQPAQRDGGNHNGRRIREEDFRTHFGREHHFRVARRDDRRFNYGGYWFVYNNPWPSEWSYDDDVYVDESDGEYYLVDPVHPGFRLSIVIGD
jgi:TolA-binding protein